MPHDLLDAARIDGAGELKVSTRIATPLATPVISFLFSQRLLVTGLTAGATKGLREFADSYLAASDE
jgi:ABC-type glycerol-3-phosphate transport system permease component